MVKELCYWDIGPLRAPEHNTYTNIQLRTPRVLVWSITNTITPSTIYSIGLPFNPLYVEYCSTENKTIVYLERWLDGTNSLRESGEIPAPFPNGNLTFPRRNMTDPNGNLDLGMFGETLALPLEVFDAGNNRTAMSEATNFETSVSGAFVSVHSFMQGSPTQYLINPVEELPKSLMPEAPLFSSPGLHCTMTVYNLGYGFLISSRTTIVGITILIAHAVTVMVSSICQLFWQQSVMDAWNTISGYVALSIGSVTPAQVLDNTCTGI